MNDNNITTEPNKDNDTLLNCKESSRTPIQNKSFKKLRKKQKDFLERIQVVTEPKSRNLTQDQEDFLNRIGRYAPYRPAGTEVEEEDEEYW